MPVAESLDGSHLTWTLLYRHANTHAKEHPITRSAAHFYHYVWLVQRHVPVAEVVSPRAALKETFDYAYTHPRLQNAVISRYKLTKRAGLYLSRRGKRERQTGKGERGVRGGGGGPNYYSTLLLHTVLYTLHNKTLYTSYTSKHN